MASSSAPLEILQWSFKTPPEVCNVVAWSQHNLVAVAMGSSIRIIDPTQPDEPPGIIRVGKDSITQSQTTLDTVLRQTPIDAFHSVMPARIQTGLAAFQVLCWSPPGCAADGGCLLAASNSLDFAAVYTAPLNPFTTKWDQTVVLSRILREYFKSKDFCLQPSSNSETHAHEGRRKTPISANQWLHRRDLMSIRAMAWSSIFCLPSAAASSGQGQGGQEAEDGGQRVVLLAVAGKTAVTVLLYRLPPPPHSVASSDSASTSPPGAWQVVLSFAAHPTWTCALHWVANGGSAPPAGVAQEWDLVTGSIDGEVLLWRLRVSLACSVEDGSSAPPALVAQVCPVSWPSCSTSTPSAHLPTGPAVGSPATGATGAPAGSPLVPANRQEVYSLCTSPSLPHWLLVARGQQVLVVALPLLSHRCESEVPASAECVAHTANISGVVWTSGDHFLSCSTDGQVKGWKVHKAPLALQQADPVWSATLSQHRKHGIALSPNQAWVALVDRVEAAIYGSAMYNQGNDTSQLVVCPYPRCSPWITQQVTRLATNTQSSLHCWDMRHIMSLTPNHDAVLALLHELEGTATATQAGESIVNHPSTQAVQLAHHLACNLVQHAGHHANAVARLALASAVAVVGVDQDQTVDGFPQALLTIMHRCRSGLQYQQVAKSLGQFLAACGEQAAIDGTLEERPLISESQLPGSHPQAAWQSNQPAASAPPAHTPPAAFRTTFDVKPALLMADWIVLGPAKTLSALLPLALRVYQTAGCTHGIQHAMQRLASTPQAQPNPGSIVQDATSTSHGNGTPAQSLPAREHCPVCQAPVALSLAGRELGRETCRNGHQLERCFVTMCLLPGLQHRRCLTCGQPTSPHTLWPHWLQIDGHSHGTCLLCRSPCRLTLASAPHDNAETGGEEEEEDEVEEDLTLQNGWGKLPNIAQKVRLRKGGRKHREEEEEEEEEWEEEEEDDDDNVSDSEEEGEGEGEDGEGTPTQTKTTGNDCRQRTSRSNSSAKRRKHLHPLSGRKPPGRNSRNKREEEDG